MLKAARPWLLLVLSIDAVLLHAQQRSTMIIAPMLDESILILTDKPMYYPGDTLQLSIRREGKGSLVSVTPMVAMEGVKLVVTGQDNYYGVIPKTASPGPYRILIRMVDANGQRSVHETGRTVEVEEHQVVESLERYVSIVPWGGTTDPQNIIPLQEEQLRSLFVEFRRNNIHERMGPQFLMIRTLVQLRNGSTSQSFERRVMTFRSHGNPERDRDMFLQYRTAYGPYAAISAGELDHVLLPLDSLPEWATIRVTVEPDYTIRIGAYDRSNTLTRYFRVKGPTIEIGLSLGIPKVLFDTQPNDVIEYGNTSTMVRVYHVDEETGNRFPVSLGAGTFGGRSPIDLNVGRGGFAVSAYLDLVELTRIHDLGFIKRVNAGLELTPFFPIKRRSRVLIDAQVGFSL